MSTTEELALGALHAMEKWEALQSLRGPDPLEILFKRCNRPKRLVIEDVVCTLRGDFQLITFYDSKKEKHDVIVPRTKMIYGDICGDIFHRLRQDQLLDIAKSLSYCAHHGIYLEELTLSEFYSSTIMSTVGELWCENLTKLEFVYDKTQQVDFYIQAFAHLNKLLSITIQGCKINLFPIEIINNLPENINEIHLFFEQSSSEQKQPLFFSLEKFKDLHRLTIRYCNLVNMIEDIISKKPTLDYLDIRGSNWAVQEKKSWVFNGLVNLKHIDLSAITYDSDKRGDWAKSINSAVVSSIFDTCKYLEYFDMSSELCLDQSEPINISLKNWANLGNLNHFSICWKITDDFATKMVKYCKKLKYLDCKNKNHVIIKKLTELKNLECLKLHEWIFYSAEIITAISKNCKKLKRLEIVHSDQYVNADKVGESLSSPYILNELSKLQYLEHLDLSRSKIDTTIQLQDTTFKFIADNCKNLKYLNIGGCISLTADAFDDLIKFENLKELTVDHNIAITNKVVGKLKGLKFFSCVGCLQLIEAPAGIIRLMKNCPGLEQIIFGSIDNNIALETIIAIADLATMKRVNNTILYMRISQELSEHPEIEIESPWLLIKY